VRGEVVQASELDAAAAHTRSIWYFANNVLNDCAQFVHLVTMVLLLLPATLPACSQAASSWAHAVHLCGPAQGFCYSGKSSCCKLL